MYCKAPQDYLMCVLYKYLIHSFAVLLVSPVKMCWQPAILPAFSPFLAAYSTLDFTMSSLAGKGTWCLLPTTPSMLPTATKHFDRAGWYCSGIKIFKKHMCSV